MVARTIAVIHARAIAGIVHARAGGRRRTVSNR
jgi:hypothetical protein